MIYTTKRGLRAAGACEDRYNYLCTWAPEGDDEPISLLDILANNGADDAIWALRACDGNDDIARWLARWAALTVIHRRDAPDIVARYLRTGDETIRAASWAASRAAGMSRSGNCLRRLLVGGIPAGDITDEMVIEHGREE